MSMNRTKTDRPAARFTVKGDNGLYIKECIPGVMPQWTPDLADAKTWASASYAQAKIERFHLNGKVRPVAAKVAH